MVYSYVYGLWAVFIFLESVCVTLLRGKDLEPLRAFMIFCVFRDLLLMASSSTQWYWDIGWAGKEIELVWLAGIAGFLVKPGRSWRLPAATLSVLFLTLLLQRGWPFHAQVTADLHILQRVACVIILGTLLIGIFLGGNHRRLQLFGAVVCLAGSDMVSAQSYLAGNFSPRLAAAIWVFGLCILVTAAKGSAGLIRRQQCEFPAAQSSSSSSQMSQVSARPSETTPASGSWPSSEFLRLPCRMRVQ